MLASLHSQDLLLHFQDSYRKTRGKCLERNISCTDCAEQRPFQQVLCVLHWCVSHGAGWKGLSEARELLPDSPEQGDAGIPVRAVQLLAPNQACDTLKMAKKVLTVQFVSFLLPVPQTENFSITARERKVSSSSCHTNYATGISAGCSGIDPLPVQPHPLRSVFSGGHRATQ